MTSEIRCSVSCLAVALLAGTALAQTSSPQSYPLLGIVRDFAPQHPDFANNPGDSAPLSAGNVGMALSQDGLPVYVGGGALVSSPARDTNGHAIAAHLYSAPAAAAPVTNFTITGASIQSSQSMAVKVRVIGAAIVSGSYDCGVTTRINVGTQIQAPFGSFSGAVSGNVNDNQNPRSAVLSGLVPPGTKISVDGQSWVRKSAQSASLLDSDWKSYMTVNSASGGRQVVALRNGDKPPAVGGFQGQVSAKAMLTPYMNAAGNISLLDNQVIYLFELGSTDTASSAFDQQDLVVLVDLATDPSYFDTPTTTPAPSTNPCVTIHDSPASLGGTNGGAVQSAQTFASWFNTVAGQNASKSQAIDITLGADGVYSFSAPDFDPARGELYAADPGPHNRGFTYAVDATCTYTQCGRQFIELGSDTDAWMYVNGQLVADMGGTHTGASQFVDMDRLGLRNGETASIKIFYAQRASNAAAFSLRTNIVLMSSRDLAVPGVTALYD